MTIIVTDNDDETAKMVFSVEITEELHNMFAKISGCYFPVHFDNDFARKCGFKKCVSFGFLSFVFAARFEEMISKLKEYKCMVGFEWSGQFKTPIYIGDTLSVLGMLGRIRKSTNVARIEATVTNQNDEIVSILSGKVKMLENGSSDYA